MANAQTSIRVIARNDAARPGRMAIQFAAIQLQFIARIRALPCKATRRQLLMDALGLAIKAAETRRPHREVNYYLALVMRRRERAHLCPLRAIAQEVQP